jgi:hypothetical protein
MRHRIRRSPLLLAVCLPALLAASTPAPRGVQEPVWRAAGAWLGLLDARNYTESWNQAARVFQRAVTAEAWARQAAPLRERSGDPIARELVDIDEVTDPPGVPPGDYVRLQFKCECSRAGLVQEIMLMVNDGERGWRVASYRVEPASRG